MKNITLLALVIASSTLAACGRGESPSAPSASNMPNMPASQPPAAGQPPAENRGMGVVQAVDAANEALSAAGVRPLPESLTPHSPPARSRRCCSRSASRRRGS